MTKMVLNFEFRNSSEGGEVDKYSPIDFKLE